MTIRPRSLALLAAAALAVPVAACNSDPAPTAEGDTTVVVEDNGPAGTNATAPMVDTTPQQEDTGDHVSISRDGVQATVRDGDTTVRADVDGNPGVDIEVN